MASPLAGITMISVSLLILPPARNFVYGKTKKELSFTARSLTAFVIIVVAGMFNGLSHKQQELAAQEAIEQAEKIALIKQQNIDYFFANKETIITALNTNLTSNDYQAVVSTSSKYLASGDDELNKLYSTAKDKIQKDNKTKDLLAELKKTPTKEFEKNKNLYNQLASLYPDNEKYKNKVDFYSKKIEKQKEIKLAEARTKKIDAQFSGWDGSHRQLEKLIKQGMNDPDSYVHVETMYSDKKTYLIVVTRFRGRNAFGGMVRNFVKAKVSLDGQILQILDET